MEKCVVCGGLGYESCSHESHFIESKSNCDCDNMLVDCSECEGKGYKNTLKDKLKTLKNLKYKGEKIGKKS